MKELLYPDVFYSFIEEHTDIEFFPYLKNLFYQKELLKELLTSFCLSDQEKAFLTEELHILFEKYTSELIDILDLPREMQKLLKKLQQKNAKTKVYSLLHSLTLSFYPESLQSRTDLLTKISSIKSLLQNPHLTDFEIFKMLKNLEKIENLFAEHIFYSEQELLDNLDRVFFVK